MTLEERNRLVLEARPMVTRYLIAYARRYPPHVQEDAIADGLASLPRSAEAYDPSRRMSFVNYAIRRAVGAMIDGLRAGDHLSRSERRAYARSADQAAAEGQELPSDGAPFSLEYLVGDGDSRTLLDVLADPDAGPDETVILGERAALVHAAIRRLPERERFIVELSFFDHIPMAEIAPALGVTESRVSQLRSKALQRMRWSLERRGLAA